MKKLFSILILVLLITLNCAAAEEPQVYQLGDKIEDFSVTDASGKTVTLSGLLQEKEMVLINLWATWCSSCRSEFPVIEEAYLQYQDQIEIIALSIEPQDTQDVLADFVQGKNLSFTFAQDTPGFYDKFGLDTIPSCIVIDRFGTICFIGNIVPQTEFFLRMFDAFTGDGYDQSLLLTDVPAPKPPMEPSSEEQITAALGAAAFNSQDAYIWPMLVSEKDGRSVVASSIAGVPGVTAEVTVKVEAKAGDAIAITFRTSTEPSADVLSIRINGEQVKLFGGEHDWMTFAYPVESDGAFDVALAYTKDDYSNAGEDTVWIDSVTVLSGQAAADAIAANPVYPTGDAITLLPVDCPAKEIAFDDPDGILDVSFFSPKYYIVDADAVTVQATLTEDVDPEGAFFSHLFGDLYSGLISCMTEDGYRLNCEVDSIPEDRIPFTAIMLGLDPAGTEIHTLLLFRNEENVESFIKDFTLSTWFYVDAEDDARVQNPVYLPEATYTIRCVDQNGEPVPGVTVQICDAASCRIAQTDADGLHTFTSVPNAWEIHIQTAPDGYTADSKEIVIAPLTGGEIVLTLNRN